MDYRKIRHVALVAIASDDQLFELLVLKGGNALELIHRVGNRGSLDLDFSMERDVDDRDALSARLTHALSDRFDAEGYIVFDTKLVFKPVPRTGTVPQWWGGYTFSFKLIPQGEYIKYKGDLDEIRRRATPIDDANNRVFEIQISRYEHCAPSEVANIDLYSIRVYTLGMIVCEKLRAICQQMEEYEMSGRKARAARARDFYDIAVLVEGAGVNVLSAENVGILQAMFRAKHVPLSLLRLIRREREFHRSDWARVENAVRGQVQGFDYYFQVVLDVVDKLDAAGVIDPP